VASPLTTSDWFLSLSFVKLLTAGHLSAAKVEAGSQTSEGSSQGLLVAPALDELFQLSSKKTADAGAALCGQRPRALQKLSINGDSHLLFHRKLPLVNS
jgi:hypothetical protein